MITGEFPALDVIYYFNQIQNFNYILPTAHELPTTRLNNRIYPSWYDIKDLPFDNPDRFNEP